MNELSDCPVCDGSGRLKATREKGPLRVVTEVKVRCWACRGTGTVSFERELSITDSVVRDMIDSAVRTDGQQDAGEPWHDDSAPSA